jgi:lipopolysaccharide/colanic/teichoic acid biosynthesis glycosyltransferase
LIVLSPILFLTGCIVLITSGWPVFYVSRRVGQQGARMIALLKFRTMERDADRKKEQIAHLSHRDGPLFKVHNDPRVTSCGAFLRRWTLDELPQLLNVFIGHMSLVGPRPHLPSEVNRYNDYQRRVFTVKPGMTGLAQISGRSNLRFDDEVRFDLRYIEEWSLFLDLWILWRTFIVVLRGEGAD